MKIMAVNEKLGYFISIFIIILKSVLSANIIYVSPIASPSHHIWNKAFALGLVRNGHNVTMLTHEVDEKVPANLTIITMEGVYDRITEVMVEEDLAEQSVISTIITLYDYAMFVAKYDFNTSGLQVLLNYPKNYKFDLMIYDVTIGRHLYPIAARFQNPPVLAVTPFLLPPALSYVFGNHLHTSYIPFYSTKYTNEMNLFQRTINFIYTYTEVLYRNYIFLPKEDTLIKGRFKDLDFSVDELERRTSFLLCNVDSIMDYPEPLPPNIIPVGGLHAKRSNPLPKDLQKIVDESTNGVIVFSLGTNVRSDKLNIEVRKSILKAFSKLPQTVLWKFESDDIDDLPKNVYVRKWLPINDILGHKNAKVFINHGGALSVQEAIYHDIPIVGIPYVADQHVNIQKLVEKGVAVYLNKDQLTTENMYKAIQKALNVASFKMHELSKRYHDQPMSALERAVFWAEYLLRHGNVEHLVSAARDMPGYQTYNLDAVVVLLSCLVLIYSLVLLLIFCVKLMCSVSFVKKEADIKMK